jgi:branched-chain amino acid transport system substrate-binding protein
MKLRVTLVAVPVLALVIVAAAFAGTNGGAVTASPSAAAIACGTTRTIGVAAPITGPAASIGQQQLRWAQYFVKRWNAVKANAKQKIAIVQGDTQLGVDTAFAVKVAQAFASNPKILGVVGPAGSQEVVASTSALQGAGFAWVTGSATRVSLTDGHTDGVNRQGYFFRTVPNDGVQGPTVANFIRLKIKATRVVIIDDQEVYSQGLADNVQASLKAHGVNVTRESVSQDTTDFSSLIAKIPGNTNIIYIPWQLSPRAQAFGQQLRGAGKNITLFGSDGLFDPATWKITGSYDSFFPVDTNTGVVKAYAA